MTFGHTRARYFPPENGGLIPQGTPLAGGVFRIDHDQEYQQNVVLRYQRPNERGMDRVHLALRQRPGGQRGAGRRRGIDADARATGDDRLFLRRSLRDLQQPDHDLQWRGQIDAADSAPDRNRKRRPQSRTA